MILDELGPEVVVRVSDPATGMRGILVVDNTINGPAGGGTRMVPDISEQEVADLARAMTYKWAIFGLPTGGAKAGIYGDAGMPAEQKRTILRAFGRALTPYLRSRDLGVLLGIGPDMGIGGGDTDHIYEGAETPNVCPTLYTWSLDGDSASYHMTGFGVVAAARAALKSLGRPIEGATFAIEGFGQAGVGTARYAVRQGARVVALTTLLGGVHEAGGIDIERMLELRRSHGDACVLEYGRGDRLAASDLITVPADVFVPGARPREIDSYNEARARARIICPAGNLCVTLAAEDRLHRRGVLVVPDFVANGGGIIVSWVDILGGNAEQALETIGRLVGTAATSILEEAKATKQAPGATARARVRDAIFAAKRSRYTFDELRARAQAVVQLKTPAAASR